MSDKSRPKARLWLVALLSAAVVIVVWQLLGHVPLWFYPENLEDASRYGDAFGYVNSLFSALAFLGIIATILLQRQELQLQREELEQTREELRRSAEAQEKSQAALREQVEWLSLAPYLNVLIAISEHRGGRTGEEAGELLAEVIDVVQPTVIKQAKASIDRRKRARYEFIREQMASSIRDTVAKMKAKFSEHDYSKASIDDAVLQLDYHQSHLSAVRSDLGAPLDIDVQGLLRPVNEAINEMQTLVEKPYGDSGEVDLENCKRFWVLYQYLLQRLENWLTEFGNFTAATG